MNSVHSQTVSLIWNIADDVLRDIFVRGQYRDVILRVSRNLVGINFRHPNVMPNFAVWKTITYRHWHRWCCQPRF